MIVGLFVDTSIQNNCLIAQAFLGMLLENIGSQSHLFLNSVHIVNTRPRAKSLLQELS